MNEMSLELRNFIEELDKIMWFENVGKPVLSNEVKQVFSWSNAWECLQHENRANASFHNHLDSLHPAWDIAYDKALNAASKSSACQELEEGISAADAVAYDVAAAAVEIATSSEETFFTNLMHWYRLGHWPCGWEGRYPEGKLIVY